MKFRKAEMTLIRELTLIFTFIIVIGCNEQRKPRNKPIDNVEDTTITATSIHRKSASDRADAYDKLADAIDAKTVSTVNQVMDLTNPLFDKAGNDYTIAINGLRKLRLHDADDQLPDDAAKVFRLFAKEYREAAK